MVGLVCLVTTGFYLFAFFGRRMVLPDMLYHFVIQPGVSEESVRLVVTGLEISDQFLSDRMNQTLSKIADIRVSSFTPCSPLTPIGVLAPTAQVLGNRMCVNTLSGVWREALAGNPGIAISVIAHEHYHLVQNELGCLPPPWAKEYDWIIEGGAAYIGWETVVAAGHLEREWVSELLEEMVASKPELGPLSSYENEVQGDAAYSLAYQAVDQLVAKTDSPGSLNDFCTRVGEGIPWQDSFEQVFGLSLEDFYAEFEASRFQKVDP